MALYFLQISFMSGIMGDSWILTSASSFSFFFQDITHHAASGKPLTLMTNELEKAKKPGRVEKIVFTSRTP